MFGKKGDSKYDILLALIAGILVVGIVLFWMFSEYFGEDDLDWEACRESLILRNAAPEGQVSSAVDYSTKDVLPLKCQTRVVNIDYENRTKAEQEIGKVMSECWYMVGRGEYEVFPGYSGLLDDSAVPTPCIACARIHLDGEVRDFYRDKRESEEADDRISLRNSVSNQLEGYEVSVWDYLNPERGAQAMPYFADWSEEGFSIDKTRDTGRVFDPKRAEVFSFPLYFNPDDGDLFIIYAEPRKEAIGKLEGERKINPYMVFLQSEDYGKLSEYWAEYDETSTVIRSLGITLLTNNGVRVCSSIESAPA